jgi:deoxyribodipyrimidine photo-lyase
MSSPLTAFNSCSLISAHLAFGTISLREVFSRVEERRAELQQAPKSVKGKWPSALKSFGGRLRWHCHFIQKLEDEPRLEFENFHPAYNSLRQEYNQQHLQAWMQGKTGGPMVAAVMRCLIAGGWINFRMRAMLMSFASYHLWLPWQKTAPYLAQLFTDYEPGIHYSQVQMQSGTTGINAVRIYNPIKQSFDHDPQGIFIRKWLPELSQMDQEFIHTPWQKPELMNDYPMPIVDEVEARKMAAQKIYAVRKELTHKNQAQKIVTKHGSRKSGIKKTIKPKKLKSAIKEKDDKQGDLFG